MNKAIIIGAGQIGRGLIGMELEKAGYHVLFADINQSVIDDINTRGEYTVHILDTECEDTVVRNISAINSLGEEFPSVFADDDVTIVCTSVGQTALINVAPTIAEGIELRMNAGIAAFMNIIAVENAICGTSQLKGYIYEHLNEKAKTYADKYIGFPNCAVDRIIPTNRADTYAADVVVEGYFEWDIEKSNIKTLQLLIDGLSIVDDLAPYLERKLFMLNGPNAVTACLGYLKGYATIKESLEDREIYDVAWSMMEECGAMLEKRHGFTAEQMLDYRTILMQRFMNPHIIDSVTRVAREPIRKLSPNDRVVAPMNYAREYDIKTPAYYTGIAAILLYDNEEDNESVMLRRLIAEKNVAAVLHEICNLAVGAPEITAIEKEYARLRDAVREETVSENNTL